MSVVHVQSSRPHDAVGPLSAVVSINLKGGFLMPFKHLVNLCFYVKWSDLKWRPRVM
jgi:hypothetical protein